ncbi:MAG: NAD(P)/FAD-dependent oxidoreductase [Acidobacteria bacterium]|nr:NAD(P)/FAD-dependent oxidoreductase [Acidobacteriota bacterium]
MNRVIVVGGGLAGLTAAAYLARGGTRVTVVEQSRELGGRARTSIEEGFSFNLGPHAVYLAGAGAAALDELGIPYEGGQPGGGSFVQHQGKLHTLPEGLVSLVSTGLFGLREKMEIASFFTGLQGVDIEPLARVRFADWLAEQMSTTGARGLVTMLARISTYTHPTSDMSAGAAIRQMQLAFQKNVRYVNGGWQTLVEALRRQVEGHGGDIVSGVSVRSLARDSALRGVVLENGETLAADAVILAGSPHMVAQLTGITHWAATRVPVHAACLDVALRHLPHPSRKAAFGLEEPLYASVHSAVANLAPEGSALIHLARYGGLQGREAGAVRLELETLLDQLQPGWRQYVVKTRFLPDLTVSNAAVLASQGGLAARPQVAVPGLQGLFLAGDWIGPEGMIADASFSSGRSAAKLILNQREQQSEAA